MQDAGLQAEIILPPTKFTSIPYKQLLVLEESGILVSYERASLAWCSNCLSYSKLNSERSLCCNNCASEKVNNKASHVKYYSNLTLLMKFLCIKLNLPCPATDSGEIDAYLVLLGHKANNKFYLLIKEDLDTIVKLS